MDVLPSRFALVYFHPEVLVLVSFHSLLVSVVRRGLFCYCYLHVLLCSLNHAVYGFTAFIPQRRHSPRRN